MILRYTVPGQNGTVTRLHRGWEIIHVNNPHVTLDFSHSHLVQ